MIHKEFETPASLGEFVQLLWGMASENSDDRFPRERIMPDGIVELVFHFAQPFRTYRADGTHYQQPQAFAISQMREFIEIESNGEIGFVAVRFFPWGAHHFFKKPVNEFVDNYVLATELWPEQERELAAIVSVGLSMQSRIELLAKFLSDRLDQHCSEDQQVDTAIRRLRQMRGQLSIDTLCLELDVNERKLQRQFAAAVGTSPKTFARVSRFLDICHRLGEFREKTMAELAHYCGYYDQSHFNREFRQFSGFTPLEFFQRDDIGYADL